MLQLRSEGRYRTFFDIERQAGAFPAATKHASSAEQRTHEVTVFCNNDYLGMGQHPKVLNAMTKAVLVRYAF